MGKYRQGRKIFWATLALLLLIVAMPLSVAGVEYWNEHIAGTESVAYELNNETLTSGEIYTGSGGASFKFYYTSAGQTTYKELSPFWAVNGSWNQVIYPAYTENISYPEFTVISWNLSAAQIMKDNINEIHIKLQGLKNTTNLTNLQIYMHTPIINNNPNGLYYLYQKNIAVNNGTIDQTIEIQPAVAAMLNSEYGNTSIITIIIKDYDSAHSPFPSNGVVNFQIYATHPHGRFVWGGYDATTVFLAIWTGIGLMVLFVTSPAWNPTTHNGLIEHIIQHRRYSRASRSRSSRRSRRTHRTHRSSHRRSNSRRRRR